MLGSAIMLLGKQIPLSAIDGEAPAGDFGASSEKTEHEEAEKVTVDGKWTEKTHENEEALMDEHDSVDMETEKIQPAIKSKNGEVGETEQCDTNLKDKTSKKPEKTLPCPRCKSMETKFCYYNNYNVNQPRYFCKACQRYWTSGGTIRNMPVGAGRRKNKNSSLAYEHITASETLQSVRIDGKVINFGHEISDDCSSISSVTVSDSVEEGVEKSSHKQYSHDLNVSYSYMPFFAGVSWPCFPPGFPLSIYNGSTPPWFFSRPSSPSSAKNSPTLGKHSRDSDMSESCSSDNKELHNKHTQGRVLVPKTLRVGNPDEAAKSSIWAALGIKNEWIGRGDIFKDFQSKGVETTCFSEKSSILQANPAALTRSLAFHETA